MRPAGNTNKQTVYCREYKYIRIQHPSTNANPIFDDKFEQKFDNKKVWMHKTQQMDGNGQQIISTNGDPWNNAQTQFGNRSSTILEKSYSQQMPMQSVSVSVDQGTSDKNFITDATKIGRSRLSSSSSPSYSIQITNGKYIISLNNGDCVYKTGKIIENDVIRAMTDTEMQKIQSFINGQINVPCFCAKC